MTTAAHSPPRPAIPSGRATSEVATPRTTADLSGLLVELSRLVKALAFYPEDSAQRRAMTERTFLAWQADLTRSGPLALIALTGRFTSPGLDGGVPFARVENVASALTNHCLERIDFTAALDRQAFGAFAQWLAGESAVSDASGVDPAGWQLDRDGIAIAVDEAPPEAVPGDRVEPAVSEAPPNGEPSSGTPEDAAPEVEAAPLPRASEHKPTLEESPLTAPPDRRATELVGALAVLDDCEADDDYRALSAQIVRTAGELSREGFADDAYRVALVLADHAVGVGGRSGAQALQAHDMLTLLATDALLPDLIGRASSRLGSEAVRAAQVLLQLGAVAAPALFDALLREPDRDRAAQLSGLFVALGDRARETLERQLQRPGGPQARLAARLAGELQNPALVGTLVALLGSSDAALRKEAAKALVTIGGRASIDSLIVSLSSGDDELVGLAALCLGELRDSRAVPALLRELERTASAGRFDCAREIARSLGQIGAEEAIPRLGATLGLRGFTQRRKRRELKLAAVAALGKFHCKDAHIALARAVHNGDPRVRERAQQLLSRNAASTKAAAD